MSAGRDSVCGIVGVARRGGLSSQDRIWAERATRALLHRGPNSLGLKVSEDCAVAFGHTRLAVIDLSPEACQPMRDPQTRVSITFNGEIFSFQSIRNELHGLGHHFTSMSDTEVILRGYLQWGESVVDRLVGQFAFAIHDPRAGTVFLARDRMGEKPLYYTQDSNSLAFGSELKVLLSRPGQSRVADPVALDHYLRVGYSPPGHSMVEGISKLLPGQSLTWKIHQEAFATHQYWSPSRFPVSPNRIEGDDRATRLESLLRASVHSQMVSDVPLGVLLSGGLDSSLITALAAEASPSLKTFTVTFPNHSDFDEGHHARIVSRSFATDHTEIAASEIGSSVLLDMIQGLDDPIADSSAIATYTLSNLVSKHCTVALGGDGGDEVFGGYLHYSHLRSLMPTLNSIPWAIRAPASTMLLRAVPDGFRGRYWLSALGTNINDDQPALNPLFRSSDFPLLDSTSRTDDPIAHSEYSSGLASLDGLARARFWDIIDYLPNDILLKVDRMSMLNSLEIRAPFLDRDLVEFVLCNYAMPDLVSRRVRKAPLRDLARKLLPPKLSVNRKQGFSVPLLSWLRSNTEWHVTLTDILMGSSDTLHGMDLARRLLKAADHGHDTSQQIYALAVLEIWRQHFQISFH